ncbi:hypothetical protein Francci3_0042 [Frankia casuarinae]|uniref:Uncharacterized protein n=1 Tax=Frankia casuarinae (strain DSM 45818 / CECT 9043 / HFP020203 / CcI3) TaxID=106370 RepID=Q2JH06_FRACC|nr:hypothetical protein Francci3_0042 [Frankia casuarinae]
MCRCSAQVAAWDTKVDSPSATPPSAPTALCTTSAALPGAVTAKNRANSPTPYGQKIFFIEDLTENPVDTARRTPTSVRYRQHVCTHLE